MQAVPNLRMSRSYTSRAARAGEQHGVDYNFISRERFEAMAQAGEFLEWADVFGNFYGTCAADTERCWPAARTWCSSSTSRARGRCGASGIASVGIFVLPPSAADPGAAAARAQQGHRGADSPAARGGVPTRSASLRSTSTSSSTTRWSGRRTAARDRAGRARRVTGHAEDGRKHHRTFKDVIEVDAASDSMCGPPAKAGACTQGKPIRVRRPRGKRARQLLTARVPRETGDKKIDDRAAAKSCAARS